MILKIHRVADITLFVLAILHFQSHRSNDVPNIKRFDSESQSILLAVLLISESCLQENFDVIGSLPVNRQIPVKLFNDAIALNMHKIIFMQRPQAQARSE